MVEGVNNICESNCKTFGEKFTEKTSVRQWLQFVNTAVGAAEKMLTKDHLWLCTV